MAYRKVENAFWTDEKLIQLDFDSRILYLYFLTSSNSNSIGAYHIPIMYIVSDIYNPINSPIDTPIHTLCQKIERAIDTLSEALLIAYDKNTSVVVINKHLKHNPIDSPKHLSGALKAFHDLPKSPILRERANELEKLAIEKGIEFENPYSGNDPDSPIDRGIDTTERETETETDTETEINIRASHQQSEHEFDLPELNLQDALKQANEFISPDYKLPPLKCSQKQFTDYPKEFLDFWDAYPLKKGKGAAFNAWKKAKNKPATQDLIAIIHRQKRWPEWTKDSGTFIPHPATWLNQQRWDDEQGPKGTIKNSHSTLMQEQDNEMRKYIQKHNLTLNGGNYGTN